MHFSETIELCSQNHTFNSIHQGEISILNDINDRWRSFVLQRRGHFPPKIRFYISSPFIFLKKKKKMKNFLFPLKYNLISFQRSFSSAISFRVNNNLNQYYIHFCLFDVTKQLALRVPEITYHDYCRDKPRRTTENHILILISV